MARRYSHISGMTVITCDHVRHPVNDTKPWCPNDFRSASIQAVIPEQLAAAGWTVRTIGTGESRITQYLCREHKPRPRMEIAGGIDPNKGSTDPPASRFL